MKRPRRLLEAIHAWKPKGPFTRREVCRALEWPWGHVWRYTRELVDREWLLPQGGGPRGSSSPGTAARAGCAWGSALSGRSRRISAENRALSDREESRESGSRSTFGARERQFDLFNPCRGGGRGLYAAFSTTRKVGGRISIGRALEAYTRYIASRGYSPHTIRMMGNLASAFYRLSGLEPRSSLSDVTPSAAERVMRGLQRRYREGTAWTYSVRLLGLFRVFAAGGLILENPFDRLSPPPKPRPLMGPTLTPPEIIRLLKAPRGNLPSGLRNRAILEVFYSTAIRLAECAHLETGDLDFSRGTLMVRNGKGGKDWVVPLGEEAIRWVKRYLKRVRPRFAPKEERTLWVGQGGRPVAPGWIQIMVRWMGRRARIGKPVTPHTLRRTCAMHLLEGGAPAWAVKEILGHVDAKTLSRYLRLDLRRLKETHEKKHPRA